MVHFGAQSLPVTSFANIFSHSMGCLFVLFMVSSAVQKLLSLIKSHLFVFVFISITLEDRLKRLMLWFMSESVLPMFSSNSFVGSGLTFLKSIYHTVRKLSSPCRNSRAWESQLALGLNGRWKLWKGSRETISESHRDLWRPKGKQNKFTGSQRKHWHL